jgi:hypothetical protein
MRSVLLHSEWLVRSSMRFKRSPGSARNRKARKVHQCRSSSTPDGFRTPVPLPRARTEPKGLCQAEESYRSHQALHRAAVGRTSVVFQCGPLMSKSGWTTCRWHRRRTRSGHGHACRKHWLTPVWDDCADMGGSEYQDSRGQRSEVLYPQPLRKHKDRVFSTAGSAPSTSPGWIA